MENFRILLVAMLFMNVNAYLKDWTTCDNYEFTYYDGGEDAIPWCEAMSACSVGSASAHLAVLDNPIYENAVFDMLDNWNSPRVWIGGNDLHSEGVWEWINGAGRFGEGWGYSNWGPNEPNQANSEEDCLEVNYEKNKWNDYKCDRSIGYVCQQDLLKTTKADFTVLAFSDTFSDSSKQTLSIENARAECKKRGMKLIRDVKSPKAKNIISHHRPRFGVSKYWIEDENDGCRTIDGIQIDDEDCTGQKFQFICEGFRPYYMKISDKAPKVVESENILVDCTASGYPVPEVTWKIDENVISIDSTLSVHQIISEGSSSLVITNAKQGDEGRYRCFATNFIDGEKYFVRTFVDVEVVKTQN